MSKSKETRYKYTYQKLNKNLRIVTPLQFNKFKLDYAVPSTEDPNEWVDTRYDIIYNHIYHTPINNEPYIVVQRYFLPNETKFNPSKLKLKIQFITTCAVVQVSYYAFLNGELDVYDPYFPDLFGGRCAIGNIVTTGVLKEEFALWYEMMKRCYDPTYHLYNYYGGLGAKPVFAEWHTYELFHRYFESAYNQTGLMPDVNDPYMYYYDWYHNREDRKHMAKQPVDSIPGYRGIPQWLTHIPFRDRPKIEYNPPGRPRKYDIEPSPNLIRHAQEQTPRVQLYTLIDPDVKYTSETWSTENFDDDN